MDIGAPKFGKPPVKVVVTVLVVVILLTTVIVGFYNFNGKSMSLSDREMRLIPTASMDGEPQDYPIPTIPKNSLVMIEKISQDEIESIKEGDVICFNYNGIIVVHRVIEIHSDHFITHGDNNDEGNNEYVPFTDVTGRVVGVSHFMGEIVTFVKTSSLLTIVGIIVLIVAIWAVVDIVKIIREGDDGEEEGSEQAVPEQVAEPAREERKDGE